MIGNYYFTMIYKMSLRKLDRNSKSSFYNDHGNFGPFIKANNFW